MRSNTDGWSNTQLNNRIDELEQKLEAVKTLMNTEAVTLWFPSKEEDDYLYDILKAVKKILEA